MYEEDHLGQMVERSETETIQELQLRIIGVCNGLVDLQWAVLQMEKGLESNREHVQLAWYFRQSKSHAQVRALLPGVHQDAMRGTPKQAYDYCWKTESRRFPLEDPWTCGEAPKGKGARVDWVTARDTIRDAVNAGESDVSIQGSLYESHTSLWVTNSSGLTKILTMEKSLTGSPMRNAPEVFIFHGATGTGKTRRVWDLHSDVFAVPIAVKGTSFWCDGYQAHPVVLMDEMPWSGLALPLLLQLLDRYPLQVPVKGGFVPWCPTKVYLTSNLHPDSWFPEGELAQIAALRRRITGVVLFEAEPEEAQGEAWPEMNRDLELVEADEYAAFAGN